MRKLSYAVYLIILLVEILIVLLTSLCILWKTIKSTMKVHPQPQPQAYRDGTRTTSFTVQKLDDSELSDYKEEFGFVYIPSKPIKVK